MTIHDWVALNCDQCLRCPPAPARTNGCCELRDAINAQWYGHSALSASQEAQLGGDTGLCTERHIA